MLNFLLSSSNASASKIAAMQVDSTPLALTDICASRECAVFIRFKLQVVQPLWLLHKHHLN